MSDHIPFEIQEQIIKKLPVKSLIKFRSVSKQWRSLIDGSKFIADYNVYEAKPQRLFISYKKKDTKYYNYNDLKPNRFIWIVDDDSFPQHKFDLPLPLPVSSHEDFGSIQVVGSSDGLICFYGDDHYAGTMMTVIWNPSIRKSVGIHVPGLNRKPFKTIFGFGVCPRTLDPKFIKIPHYIDLLSRTDRIRIHLEELEIFALSSCTWRLPYGKLPRASIIIQEESHQVVTDGFIYWLAFDKIKDGNLIISFDLTSEEFGEVHLHESLVENEFVKKHLSISKHRESLAVLEYNTDGQSQLSAIWIMGSGVPKLFTKIYTVEGPDMSIERLVGFRKSGAFIIERHDDCDDQFSREIALYEPDSKQTRKIGIVGKTCSFIVHSYMETLLLLGQPNGIMLYKEKVPLWRGGPKKRRQSSKYVGKQGFAEKSTAGSKIYLCNV